MTRAEGKATGSKGIRSKGGVVDNPKRSLDAASLLSILEWLSGDECHLLDEAGMIAGFGRRLRQIGLPLDRLTLHLMTLHPEIMGRDLRVGPRGASGGP